MAAPVEPPRPKPASPRIPVMEPVREETPPELKAPRGFRLAPVAAAAAGLLIIVAVAVVMTRARKPAPAPAVEATPAPETVQMAREVAQQEVAKQTQALRDKLAGEILTPGAPAQQRPVAAAPARTAPAGAPRQAQPPPAAGQPPTTTQSAAPQPTAAAQTAGPQATAVPTVQAPVPTAAPAATAPPEAAPTPAPVEPTPVPASTRAPLVDAQEAVQVGQLVEMGPDVAPPQPIYNPKPAYPPLAARQRVGGTVFLDVLVDENGSVQDVKVLRGVKPDLGLDAAAATAVRSWRFKPATKGGVRVKVHVTQIIPFKP